MPASFPMLTDTHCHLDIEHFEGDRGAVLARAWETGLNRILIPALEVESCQRVLALAETDPRLYATVGVHPNSATTWNDAAVSALRALASHPKVVAIGEIGLDYYWDFAPRETQIPVLRAQLELAAELQLPVVIHNRDATDEVLDMVLDWQTALSASGNPLAKGPGVLHSFSGDRKAAEKAIAAHFYLGVTGPVTFKNASSLQALIAHIPLACLLIETDSPYLTPHPHRGKRNEPANVKWIVEKVAVLKGIPMEEVARQTSENAAQLFKW